MSEGGAYITAVAETEAEELDGPARSAATLVVVVEVVYAPMGSRGALGFGF